MILAIAALAALACPVNSALDLHLVRWEQAAAEVTSYSAKFELTRTEAVFRKDRKYTGSLLLLKPTLFRLSITDAVDPNNHEVYIYDGKSIFAYEWSAKTVTEIPHSHLESSTLDLFFNFKSSDAKKRYRIEQWKVDDQHYLYLDIKPTLMKDQQDFQQIRIALYGPEAKSPLIPYSPAKFWIERANGDTEQWSFSDQAMCVKDGGKEIGPEHFQYEEPKGKGWTIRKAPMLPKP